MGDKMTLKKNGSFIERIGDQFNMELEKIKEKRMEIGIDKKKRSTRELTNLLIKHSNWSKIREDTIMFNFENE
jgi:hypothetical protein